MGIPFKKIERGAFRDLKPTECRVLLIRPGDHERNLTLPDDEDRLITQGTALRNAGVRIEAAISSAADRALEAILFTKVGLMCGGETHTSRQLAGLAAEDPDLLKRLQTEAEKAGIPLEKYLFQVCETDADLHSKMFFCGQEGAHALLDLALPHKGKTVMAASHGGWRIEVIIAALSRKLADAPIEMPQIFVERGQIVELIIDPETRELIEENYLEPPMPPM